MRQNPVYRVPMWFIASILAFSSIAPVQATVFLIDDFSIVRNDSLFFRDSFGNASPPPSVPSATFGDGTNASYNVTGTLGPESGGKLALNTSLGNLQFNFDEAAFISVLRARAQSNTNSANLNLGLKSNDTFEVVGIFDLILPATRQRFGVRLSDASVAEGNDIVDITVTRLLNNTLVIQLRHVDDLGNTNIVVDSALLDPSHEQIGLALSKENALNNTITGLFAYGDGGIFGPITTFGNTTTIFHGEEFTRAEFRVTARIVPEPSTLAIIGLGLLGIGYARRKKAA